jgi:hypothetical protein
MTLWRPVVAPLVAVTAAVLIAAGQHAERAGNRWAMYEHEMQNPVDDPPGAWENTEFAFARLRFRSVAGARWSGRWGTDCNKSDRQFIQGLRRLTRVHARSVEHIVDVDSDEIFDWPWLYAVGVGDWRFNEQQALRLRQYFDRGGFLMVDDFHNEREWASFMEGVHMILPGATAVEIEDDASIFHTVYDLSKRGPIPGLNVVHGPGYERGGVVPHWRAILDEKGRVIIAICFNMDLGDAWEWADIPEYPEPIASLAYRLGVNYVIYALTH